MPTATSSGTPTKLRRDFRKVPIGLGFDYGALVTLVAFHAPPSLFRVRNAARDCAVPPAVLDRQLETAQFPYANEAHELLVVRAQE